MRRVALIRKRWLSDVTTTTAGAAN